jgi:hypothetical protein
MVPFCSALEAEAANQTVEALTIGIQLISTGTQCDIGFIVTDGQNWAISQVFTALLKALKALPLSRISS